MNETVEELKKLLRESVFCYKEILDVAIKLKNEGHIIGIMSNHSVEWFDFIFENFEFSKFVSPLLVIVSQKVNVDKPNKGIMMKLEEAILKSYPDFQRKNLIFIDDKKVNVDSAIDFGFNSFVFNSKKQSANELLSLINSQLK